jgi:nitrite reductase (NADH) small subunit
MSGPGSTNGAESVAAAAGTPSLRRVGSLAALRSTGAFSATVAGRSVAVFALGEAVVATQGRCPHAKGPIHQGEVTGDTLTCPWHGYSFSLRTGACEDDPDLILERYEVRIDGDDILVSL